MSAFCRLLTLAGITPLFLLSGCSKPEEPVAVASVRPVKTLVVDAPTVGGVRKFPARIDAARRAELAFRVPGKVAQLLVKEGDRVAAGQTVAKLDQTDFRIVANDRQATYDNAKKNYDRAKELVTKGNISKMDFDRLEAEFKNARAALEAARQDLAYTSLDAPFAGVIAKRHIEQFEEVQAKQPVLTLQNVDSLEVKFDVPESIIRSLRADSDTEGRTRDRIKVSVSFEGLPGRQFPLSFKEIATKADPKTQTFEVTYTMEQFAGATLLPGMTATVTVDLSQFAAGDAVFTVPASAVVGDYKLDPRVWVVDEPAMTVQPRPVKLGRMLGADIEVTEGLQPGERIVIAGTPFVTEGMRVSLMPQREQAAPRPGETR